MQRGWRKNHLPVVRTGLPDGGAGVFVPMIVEPVNLAASVRHPYQLRNGISQGVELAFAGLQRRLRAFTLGDLFGRNVDGDDFTVGARSGCQYVTHERSSV